MKYDLDKIRSHLTDANKVKGEDQNTCSQMTKQSPKEPETPSGRYLKPEEIAAMVADDTFNASESNIGTSSRIDGDLEVVITPDKHKRKVNNLFHHDMREKLVHLCEDNGWVVNDPRTIGVGDYYIRVCKVIEKSGNSYRSVKLFEACIHEDDIIEEDGANV